MRLATILFVCFLVAAVAFSEKSSRIGVPGTVQGSAALYVCSHAEGGQGRLVEFKAETGDWVRDISGVAKPVDAEVGPGDAIFVTDEASGAANVRRFDPETGEFDPDPYGDTGQLRAPKGLAFDSDEHLYVADMPFIHAEVQEFDETGGFVRVLPDDPENPVLLAIEDVACDTFGDIYVTQWFDEWLCQNPGVYKFTGDAWELVGDTDELVSPWGLAFGPDGDLYVAEDRSPEPSGIYRYDGTTGASKGVYGETGSADKLAQPRYLTFGPDGDLYVSDAQNSDVRQFRGPLNENPGTYVGVFGETSGHVPVPLGLVFGGSPQKPTLLIENVGNGDMLLTLTGRQGKSYELRYTSDVRASDFTEWTLGGIINLEGSTSGSWTDDTAAEASRRFYAAQEQ